MVLAESAAGERRALRQSNPHLSRRTMKAEVIPNASITTDMFNCSFRPDTETKLQLFYDRGFRFIHWCDDWRDEYLYTKEAMEGHRRLIEAIGLKCLDVHSAETESVHICAESDEDLERYVRLLRNRIEFCSVVGGDAVVVHPPGSEKSARPLDWNLERSLQVFESLRDICEKSHIVLAIENCYRTDEKVLQYYFDRYPPEFVRLCLDSGHANVNGNLSALLRFSGRIRVLHLHDNKGQTDDHQPPFWGTVDWRSLMPFIARIGYSKPINFEITHRQGLFDGTMEEYLDFAAGSIRKSMALLTPR